MTHLDTVIKNTELFKSKSFVAKTTQVRKITQSISKKQVIDKTIQEIDLLEKKSWDKGLGYQAPHFPVFTKKLEGLESGVYIFAGESNSGKTAVMSNIFWDLVLEPSNHLYGIYLALDDAKGEVYPRIIAMQKLIPIGCVKKPAVYQKMAEENSELDYYTDYIQKRADGFNDLKRQAEYVTILDKNDSETLNDEEILTFLTEIQTTVKKNDPKGNILIAIDALDDITLKHSTDDQSSEISTIVKKWAVSLDVPIFASKHLKKINANRRPIQDDLRDSNKLIYDSQVIFLIYNDVSKNKNQAKVYYLDEDGETKCPVIEIDWCKNKKSSYKGITFCHFTPDYSKVWECTEQQGKRYEGSLYTF